MPYYELFCVARTDVSRAAHVALMKASAKAVMDRGGVVRKFESMGIMPLLKRSRVHFVSHEEGLFWLMRFDANPSAVKHLDSFLRLDTTVIRRTVIKLSDKLQG